MYTFWVPPSSKHTTNPIGPSATSLLLLHAPTPKQLPHELLFCFLLCRSLSLCLGMREQNMTAIYHSMPWPTYRASILGLLISIFSSKFYNNLVDVSISGRTQSLTFFNLISVSKPAQLWSYLTHTCNTSTLSLSSTNWFRPRKPGGPI